jgi:hypothetical protein
MMAARLSRQAIQGLTMGSQRPSLPLRNPGVGDDPVSAPPAAPEPGVTPAWHCLWGRVTTDSFSRPSSSSQSPNLRQLGTLKPLRKQPRLHVNSPSSNGGGTSR